VKSLIRERVPLPRLLVQVQDRLSLLVATRAFKIFRKTLLLSGIMGGNLAPLPVSHPPPRVTGLLLDTLLIIRRAVPAPRPVQFAA